MFKYNIILSFCGAILWVAADNEFCNPACNPLAVNLPCNNGTDCTADQVADLHTMEKHFRSIVSILKYMTEKIDVCGPNKCAEDFMVRSMDDIVQLGQSVPMNATISVDLGMSILMQIAANTDATLQKALSVCRVCEPCKCPDKPSCCGKSPNVHVEVSVQGRK